MKSRSNKQTKDPSLRPGKWIESLRSLDLNRLWSELDYLVSHHSLVRASRSAGLLVEEEADNAFSALTLKLLAQLFSKGRFQHYLDTGMTDAEIECEIGQIELTNLLAAELRKRNRRIVGRTGGSQVVISKSDLKDLIISVLDAVDALVDVRALRSLIMSRLPGMEAYLWVWTAVLKTLYGTVSGRVKQYNRMVGELCSHDSGRHRVFVCYSHKDKRWLEKLRTVLAPSIRRNTICLWDDSMIKPGDEWEEEIQNAIRSAKVVVLLVSPDFLASRFIAEHELPPILAAAKKGGVKILWVYLRACDYKRTEIAKYQAAHDISKPVKARNGARQDQELLDICDRINEAAQAK